MLRYTCNGYIEIFILGREGRKKSKKLKVSNMTSCRQIHTERYKASCAQCVKMWWRRTQHLYIYPHNWTVGICCRLQAAAPTYLVLQPLHVAEDTGVTSPPAPLSMCWESPLLYMALNLQFCTPSAAHCSSFPRRALGRLERKIRVWVFRIVNCGNASTSLPGIRLS